MNTHVRTPIRRLWTVAELDRMSEAGLFRDGDNVELIAGEIVAMPAKGNRHDRVRDIMVDDIYRRLPAGLIVSVEGAWSPDEQSYYEPDIRIMPKRLQPRPMPAAEILLLIEIADSSLDFDLGIKAQRYAEHGVQEYWVVEARSLATHVHLGPAPDGYANVRKRDAAAVLTPTRLPGMSLSLGKLEID